MAAGLGVVLSAGLVLAGVDIVHTGGAYAPALFALWALLALPLAVFAGLVLGAGNAQWGDGWVFGFARRLRADAELDRSVAAVLVAAVIVGGALALAIMVLALGLVADVNRKNIGALLLGVVVVGALPILALGALPLYRAARRITALLPAIGPLSRVLLLLVLALIALVGAGLFIIYRKLDHQALDLASLAIPALLPVLSVVLALVFYGPLDRLRRAIPARGVIAAAGTLVAIGLIPLGLGEPTDTTRDAIVERSYVGPHVVTQLRKRMDRDGDGYSPFFGGPDCDDRNREVNPGAREIVGDGLDNNCVGGDGAAAPAATATAPGSGSGAGSGSAAPPPAPAVRVPSEVKNVLLVFVDTLRFDRLGIAGYQRDGKSLTPRLDAFARESVVFSKAFAQAPNTPRSVPSLLASRYPSQLAVDDQKRDYMTILDDGNDFLFESLRTSGFRTIGMSSHFYFCDRGRDPKMCSGVVPWMKPNVLQGAEEWDNEGAQNIPESNEDAASTRTVKKALARLETLAKDGTRFAMLVHLFEPHGEYVARDGFPPITEKTASGKLSRRYDYEVATEDGHIGRLLDGLEKAGLAKTTAVVLFSDHGEAFGVHRFAGKEMFYHGQTLYRELIHVPLMFRIPGIAPRTADDVVEMIDLAPTIAELFGVAPPKTWQGRSLAPAIGGAALAPRPAFSELLPARAWPHAARSMISADGSRHVFFVFPRRWELFDLVADPDEKQDISGSDPRFGELKEQLTRFMESGS